MIRVFAIAPVAVAGLLLAVTGCATVIEDEDPADAVASAPTATEQAPVPPDVDTGLALIAEELAALSGRIAASEGDNESLELIVDTWDAIHDDVEAARPELIRGLDATIEMAQGAVDRTRPADADKASANLAEYLDTYYADS